MMRYRLAVAWLAAATLSIGLTTPSASRSTPDNPVWQVDTSWPKLPAKYVIGDVGGVSVDRHGHIWVVHRPGGLRPVDVQAGLNPPGAKCCEAAPPVLEFDADGKLLRAWGGPAEVPDWFESEHSVFVDAEDNVWLLGAGGKDGQVLKFSMDGKLKLRIGRKGNFVAPDDPTMLGMPTDMYVDTKRRELFVSDGYRNHRVIVFDADTGAFKRQWTVYGRKVDPQWASPANEVGSAGPHGKHDIFTTVHCVTMIGGELFVCDRSNERIQVFKPDGTYLREFFFNSGLAAGPGSTWDAAPVPGRPDRILVLDGINSEIGLLDNRDGKVIASYLSKGHFAGQMHWPHQMAVDAEGRIYVAEVGGSQRIQRFVPNPAIVR